MSCGPSATWPTPGIRQAYVEIMDILKTRIDEAVSAS